MSTPAYSFARLWKSKRDTPCSGLPHTSTTERALHSQSNGVHNRMRYGRMLFATMQYHAVHKPAASAGSPASRDASMPGHTTMQRSAVRLLLDTRITHQSCDHTLQRCSCARRCDQGLCTVYSRGLSVNSWESLRRSLSFRNFERCL